MPLKMIFESKFFMVIMYVHRDNLNVSRWLLLADAA